MPATMEQAIERLRKLSPERQNEIADYIFLLADDRSAPESIDPNDLEDVLEALAEVDRGERASKEEVEAAYRSFWR